MPRWMSLKIPDVFGHGGEPFVLALEHILEVRNVHDCDIALHILLRLGMDGLKMFLPEHVHLKALLLPSNTTCIVASPGGKLDTVLLQW